MTIHYDPGGSRPQSPQQKTQAPVLPVKFEPIKSGGTDSVLAAWFRKILFELTVDPNRWNQLMNAYILDPRNGIKGNNKEQSSARGNLQKELMKRKMTWKVFCKGIRFLNVFKFEMDIRLFHVSGKISHHSLTVNMGNALDIPDDDKEDANDKET